MPPYNLDVPLVACLLLASLIATTDPAAVVAIFRDLGAPARLSRLVEGEFPKFRSLIPSGYESVATLDRQVLLDALKQVTPYGQNNNPVRLTFDRERLQVDGSLQDVGRGAAAVDAKYEGEGITIAFNPVYLSDGVAAVDDNEAVIEVRDGLKPALIHGNDALAFMYLLMPVRLPG